MAKKIEEPLDNSPPKRLRPALTPQARENQLINLAFEVAEEQLLNRTASSQVISHFLRLGTERERTEREKLKLEMELTKAKTEALESQKRSEEMYTNAIAAMKSYSGNCDDEYYDEDDEDEFYDDY